MLISCWWIFEFFTHPTTLEFRRRSWKFTQSSRLPAHQNRESNWNFKALSAKQNRAMECFASLFRAWHLERGALRCYEAIKIQNELTHQTKRNKNPQKKSRVEEASFGVSKSVKFREKEDGSEWMIGVPRRLIGIYWTFSWYFKLKLPKFWVYKKICSWKSKLFSSIYQDAKFHFL